MTVETFCLGALDTNAFVVSREGSPDCWIFDAPDHPDELIGTLQRRGARPLALYLTHAHCDHMAGVTALRAAFPGLPVAQHALEQAWLSEPRLNLSAFFGEPALADPAELLVGEGEILTLGDWRVKVLHVPGHSPGSVAYWFESENEVISGDVLFRSGVGRWDFPGCDREALRASLERLCSLPDATRVRPGHGGSTTVARERASNPYLRDPSAWE